MSKTRILVTGGTGYIGSHTTVELINAGFDVVIIDNLSNSNREVLDGIEAITGVRPAFIEGDVKRLVDTRLSISGLFRHRGHYQLRRVQSRGRIGTETTALLPQQPQLTDESA